MPNCRLPVDIQVQMIPQELSTRLSEHGCKHLLASTIVLRLLTKTNINTDVPAVRADVLPGSTRFEIPFHLL